MTNSSNDPAFITPRARRPRVFALARDDHARAGHVQIMASGHDRTICGADEHTRVVRTITSRLIYNDDTAWMLTSGDGGRSLVARRAMPAGTRVFTEKPIVVAYPEESEDLIEAVTRKVLDLVCWRLCHERFEPSGDFAVVCELQSGPGTTRGNEDWARSLAKINAHGAGGTLIDPARQRRGVLGVMSSMMQHACNPSCVIHIGSPMKGGSDSGRDSGRDSGSGSGSGSDGASDSGSDDGDEGSLMSLHTIRDVAEGELLSISYVGAYQPAGRRREQLLAQHGFVCECARCTVLPELVRAFRCPSCQDGPCSPSLPTQTCRELRCDACDAITTLDAESWSRLEAAERCGCHEEGDGGDEAAGACECCQSVLHHYHYKPALFAQRTLRWLNPDGRAAQLAQHAKARQRLYASFVTGDRPHPLVAVDLENVAIAYLAAGDVAAAQSTFTSAAACFGAFYGTASADAARCTRGACVASLDELKRVMD